MIHYASETYLLSDLFSYLGDNARPLDMHCATRARHNSSCWERSPSPIYGANVVSAMKFKGTR